MVSLTQLNQTVRAAEISDSKGNFLRVIGLNPVSRLVNDKRNLSRTSVTVIYYHIIYYRMFFSELN